MKRQPMAQRLKTFAKLLKKPYPSPPAQMQYNEKWYSSKEALPNFFSDLLNGKPYPPDWVKTTQIDNIIKKNSNSPINNNDILPFPGTSKIAKIIKKFRPNAAPGIDIIFPSRLKINSILMAQFLAPLLNTMWNTQSIPDILQTES